MRCLSSGHRSFSEVLLLAWLTSETKWVERRIVVNPQISSETQQQLITMAIVMFFCMLAFRQTNHVGMGETLRFSFTLLCRRWILH